VIRVLLKPRRAKGHSRKPGTELSRFWTDIVTSSLTSVTSTTYPAAGSYVGSVATNVVTTGKDKGTYYIYNTTTYTTNYYDNILTANNKYNMSSLSDTVTMNGHFNFHYDEALKNRPNGRYLVSSWNEINPFDPTVVY